MLITIQNADFSGAGLGTVTRMRNGMIADGLVAQYLFNDLTVGGAYGSTLIDSSGLGNHATRFGKFAAPVQSALGADYADKYGCVWETPVDMSGGAAREQTILMAVKPMVGDGANLYTTHVVSSSALGLANASAAQGVGAAPTYSLNTIPKSTGSWTGAGLYNDGHPIINATGTTRYLSGSTHAIGNAVNVFALTVDGAAGRMSLLTATGAGYEITGNTYTQSWINGSRDVGNVAIGSTQILSTAFTATDFGAVALAAIYDRAMTNAEMDTLIAQAATIVLARGAGAVF